MNKLNSLFIFCCVQPTLTELCQPVLKHFKNRMSLFFICLALLSHPLLAFSPKKPAQKVVSQIGGQSPSAPKGFFLDLPLTSNYQVQRWLRVFQGPYANRFRQWLERSHRYAPRMKEIFRAQNLPVDLVYLCMIESGFLPHAVSSAKAVGYWQFIAPTAERFGLHTSYWLDERRDFESSTYAASRYLKFLYKKFGDWWLTASAYNMGEQKLSRLIKKYNSRDFWSLSQKYDFPYETAQYVPQLIAAIAIVRAPSLYGFDYLKIKTPYDYDIFYLPGGADLRALSKYINYPYKKIKALNPALRSHHIPRYMENWRVRIPKGSGGKVSSYVSAHLM